MVKDFIINLSVFTLVGTSVFVLWAISPSLFPNYLIYIALGVLVFWFFSQIGFEFVSIFSKHFFLVSVLLLVVTLIIGQVTRGTIRWIPIGNLSFQPAEIIRPFLLVFFAVFLTRKEVSLNILIKGILLLGIPTLLILVQPSLGVAILTVTGFLGVLMSADFNKKHILTGVLIFLAILPVFWFVMQPYQRQRIMTFMNPEADPLGAGYNSIQSTIAVGAGKLTGRGNIPILYLPQLLKNLGLLEQCYL